MAFSKSDLLYALGPLAGGLGTKSGRNFLFGKGSSTEQIPRLNPEQQDALSQLLQTGMSTIQDPEKGFEPIARQAKSRFEQEGIPSIAERFTSMGQGAQRSSDFMGALGSARAGLDENLAGMQANYGMQNKQFGSQLAQTGMTPGFDPLYQPKSYGLLGSMLGGGGSSVLPMLLKMLL